MSCPPVVRRALLRLGLGGAIVLGVAAAGGAVWARARVGTTPGDTRQRIETTATSRLSRVGAALEQAATDVAAAGDLVEAATRGDGSSIDRLFTLVAVDEAASRRDLAALTVYGADGIPLAWDGRPSSLPTSRLSAGATTFLLPTPLGQRLARVVPIFAQDSSRRRVGMVVAEAAVSAAVGRDLPLPWTSEPSGITVDAVMGAAPDPTDAVVRASDGAAIGIVRVSPEAVIRARGAAWQMVGVIVWTAGALVAALAWAPLGAWRAFARSTPAVLGVAGLMVVAAVAAWWMATRAIDLLPVARAVDLRALATALAMLAGAGLVNDVLVRASAIGALPRLTTGPVASLAVRLALGAAVGRAALLYPAALSLVAHPDVRPSTLAVTLTPLETGTIVAAVTMVVGHAAVALLCAALVQAVTATVAPKRGRHLVSGLVVSTAGAALAIFASGSDGVFLAPLTLAGLVLAMAAGLGPAMRLLRRGSQPARLLVASFAFVLPSVAAYPSVAQWVADGRRDVVARDIARQVAEQRQGLQAALRQALGELWAAPDIEALVAASQTAPSAAAPPDAAFLLWSKTTLSTLRLTSSVELYDRSGRLSSRFALNLPEVAIDQAWQEASCEWELFEEVSPFFAEERRLLHAGRGVCVDGVVVGSVVVHVVLDYANLPFLVAQQPYVALLAAGRGLDAPARDDIAFAVYGWSRRPLFSAGGEAWPLPEVLLDRLVQSRDAFWATLDRQGVTSDVYLLSDRGAIYAIGTARETPLAHLSNLAEVVALAAVVFAVLLVVVTAASRVGGDATLSGRALFREVRASFSRTLFLAFVAAVVVPVVALAVVTRAYMATSLRQDIEREATRTVVSASRVVEDFAAIEARGATNLPALDDSLLVWLSRVIGEDLNVFAGTGLLASSERNLFASGLLPTRTPGDTYRALVIDGQPTYLARETVGAYEYQVASALVRVADEQAIVSVPLTLRQRSIERQIDELDRRVLLAAIAFILLGSAIGYWAAERISDPVSRLTRATRRLAAGDLEQHVLVRTSDELGRLVAAFNGMADDLRRQRAQLERTNRLEAWAEMARQVAHDIKNPLTPIQLNAEHLRRVHGDRGGPLGPILDECVANILLQVRLLRQLASEFSSFASAPQAAVPAPTPLAPLLDEILSPYVHALSGRIAIETEGADQVVVHVDRLLLARALTNVIENALHAMPGMGRLRVTAAPDDAGQVRLDVIDTGVGMDQAALARIFEPYFSTKATGTGLGLTIARRNVELNGGTIAVASTPGVGTTVSMWLPRALPPREPSAA
jgi:signal transduction histidine kinase